MKRSTKTFVCSDPSKNIYGLTVRTSGIKMEGFNLNPVCLYNHDYKVVLGAWTDYQNFGADLTGVPMFDTENQVANDYFGQVERDVIKGASIGIIPLKIEGNEIVESELLEISITPVPANRNALVLYDNKGIALSAKDAKVYLLSVEKQEIKINQNTMNAKLLGALMLLCANADLTIQLSATATDEELESAINGIANKVTALKLSNTQLTSANNAFATKETAALILEKTTLLNLAVVDKRITEAQREDFGKLFDAAPDLCKSTLEALKPVTLSVIPGAQSAQADEAESKYTFDDYAQKAPLKLSAMQTANPEQFNALYAAKVASMKQAGAID